MSAAPNTKLGAFEQWASTLANMYAEHEEAVGPKNRAIAKARLDGFIAAAHIGLTGLDANVGAAPFSVEMNVLTVWHVCGSGRPAFTSANTQRKAWHEQMVAELVARWSA